MPMVPYTGVTCQGFIDYQVWLPDNTTVADMEAGLQAAGIDMIKGLPDPCNSYNVLFACESTCQAVISACQPSVNYLLSLGPEALPASPLPDCSKPVMGTDMYPGGGVPFQPDASCNSVPFKSSNSTCAYPLPGCVSPFIPDPVFASSGGLQNSDDANCGCGCCLPCPQTDAFYKPGLLHTGFFVTDILKGVSAGLALVLVISYIVLPDKLQHPSNLILFAAIAACLFSSAVAPSFGNPARVQCAANGISPATSYNNKLCLAQGAYLLFGSISTTAWLSLIIINLHLHTVWNSNWLSTRAWLSHVLGWVVPAAFTSIAVVTKSLGWNNSSMCMVTVESSNALLFVPLGAIVIPSILLHIATFVHIIRVSLQSENSETVSHSTMSSGRAARISHRRHVINAIRIQWRAAALALVISSCVLVYWAFYLVQGTKTDMSWMSTWQLCIFSAVHSQEECGKMFAEGHVPNFVFMMISEGLVSTPGLWIFLLFFKGSIIQEWKEKLSGWICCGGRRRNLKQEDEFYVI
ncbi:hypothetical protein BGW39_000254 [Mortierella sp. 14UC]|nr:hypothetical protein BGW39_000254 [Mortierella sp. 14UC]